MNVGIAGMAHTVAVGFLVLVAFAVALLALARRRTHSRVRPAPTPRLAAATDQAHSPQAHPPPAGFVIEIFDGSEQGEVVGECGFKGSRPLFRDAVGIGQGENEPACRQAELAQVEGLASPTASPISRTVGG